MGYEVIFERRAERFLKKNKKIKSQFDNAFLILAGDVFRETDECKKLNIKSMKGNLSGFYRLRIETYRAIFEIIHEKILISVVEVGHRRDIYTRSK